MAAPVETHGARRRQQVVVGSPLGVGAGRLGRETSLRSVTSDAGGTVGGEQNVWIVRLNGSGTRDACRRDGDRLGRRTDERTRGRRRLRCDSVGGRDAAGARAPVTTSGA